MKLIRVTLITLGALLTFIPLSAQEDLDFADFDVSIEEPTNFKWNSPAGKYLDPISFFSLHGYVNGVHASKSADWMSSDPTQIGRPGQLLVPNTEKSSFQYDFALILSSELSDRTRIAVETHYVSDPSGRGAAGPGGITIAVTEATGSYDLIPQYLTVSGGIFWSPFGIINEDWLGAQNSFSMIPRASGAYPIHYNERGIRVNGLAKIGDRAAINYVASFGNGVSQWDLAGQSSTDTNNGKTINARVGVFPGLKRDLEFGLSVMNGDLRDDNDTTLAMISPERYSAKGKAFGLDFRYVKNNFTLRGYTITSTENLGEDELGNSPSSIKRKGFMLEGTYEIKMDNKFVEGIRPRLRFDRIHRDFLLLNTTELDVMQLSSNVISYGVDFVCNKNIRLAFDYNVASESGQPELDNNRFVSKLIAQF